MAKQPEFINLRSLTSLGSGILIIFGSIGIYMVKTKQAGVFGLAASLFALIGVILSVGANWANAFLSPAPAHNLPDLLEGEPAGQGLITAIMASYLFPQGGLLSWYFLC